MFSTYPPSHVTPSGEPHRIDLLLERIIQEPGPIHFKFDHEQLDLRAYTKSLVSIAQHLLLSLTRLETDEWGEQHYPELQGLNTIPCTLEDGQFHSRFYKNFLVYISHQLLSYQRLKIYEAQQQQLQQQLQQLLQDNRSNSICSAEAYLSTALEQPSITRQPLFPLPQLASTYSPTMLDKFLDAVRAPVREKNAEQLRNILLVEPPLPEVYTQVVAELKSTYPKGNDDGLARICEDIAPPHPEGGSSWSAFGEVVRRYLVFLRDFDQNNYLSIYNSLHGLLNQCNVALSDSTYGVVILPTVLYLTKVLAKFAVTLDKNPEIVAQQQQGRGQSNGDSTLEKIGFVESSANVVRDAFIKCLADKSGTSGLAGPGRRGRPENKRVGIYQTANFCLKLLFQCRKLRNAEQMFVSIDNQSPPLSYYPASQRVTFLYYLGRYHFANNHFYRAQLALQAAYDRCHRDALKQRRLILIYLVTSNICLGRFPSAALFNRPEAANLAQFFTPICRFIAQGNIVEFRKFLDVSNPQAAWFLRYRILLPLRGKCEVLVWRSLVRKVFLTSGYRAEDGRGLPFLKLAHIQTAVQVLEQRSGSTLSQNGSPFSFGATAASRQNHQPIHSEFEGIEEAAAEKRFDLNDGYYLGDEVTNGNHSTFHAEQPESEFDISVAEVESIVSSLIQQGFLNGFITHENPRFAIPGAKARGALATGFPPIWQTIVSRADEDVPGWVKEEPKPAASFGAAGLGGFGGRVVNLAGARPVGAG